MRGVTHILWLDEGEGRPPFGGAENHLLVLLPALVGLGLDVELLVLMLRGGPLIRERLDELEGRGVRVTTLQLNRRRQLRWLGLRRPEHILQLARELRCRRDRVVHLHLDFQVAPISAWLVGCRRVVMTVHNDEAWFRKPWARLWLRLLDRAIRHYIAITDRVLCHYIACSGAAPEKMTRIYYGIEDHPGRALATTIRRRLGIPEEAFVVGFVGRLTYQKNPDLLLRALRRLPGVHGVIVGEGEMGDSLRRMAAEMDNVQMLGYQTAARELIPCFDLFCLPSRFEGLGLVLVEAMLSRVPIIASRAGAIPEVLCEGEYGILFTPEDEEALVEAISRGQRDYKGLGEMTERARAYALRTFRIDVMAESTKGVYEAV